MAEGEQWRTPLFARRAVMGFAPAMAQAAAGWVGRWQRHLLTLDVMERTIFSDGLGADLREVRAAMRRYFDIIGRIEPFDPPGLARLHPPTWAHQGAAGAHILRSCRRCHHRDAPSPLGAGPRKRA
jgi:hypothetical protein